MAGLVLKSKSIGRFCPRFLDNVHIVNLFKPPTEQKSNPQLGNSGTCSSDRLTGKCKALADAAPTIRRKAEFYRHQNAGVGHAKCWTSTNGESCCACTDTDYMTVDGTCNPTSEIVGCAVEISSEYGCTEYHTGY